MFGRKKIFRISLNKLDYKSALLFDKKLQNISSRKCEALFIDIAASTGKITQCEDFVNQIEHFKQQNKSIPIYTFGNEAILGPSLLVLLSGDYSFIDENTMLGLFDFHTKRNVYNKYLNEHNYQIKLVTAGRHKIRLNPFEELKEEDKQWARNLLVKEKEIFIEKVAELRGSRLKLSREELDKKLNSNFMNNEEALKFGLIDGFQSLEQFRLERYKNKKIKDATMSRMELLKLCSKTSAGDIISSANGSTLSGIGSISELVDAAEYEFMSYVFDNTLTYRP